MARKSSPHKENNASSKKENEISMKTENVSPKNNTKLSPESSIESANNKILNTSEKVLEVKKTFDTSLSKKPVKSNKRNFRYRNKQNQYNNTSALHNNMQTNLLSPLSAMYYPQVSNCMYSCDFQTLPIPSPMYSLPVMPMIVSPLQTLATTTCFVPIPAPAPIFVAPEIVPLAVSCMSSSSYATVSYYDTTIPTLVDTYTGANLSHNCNESVIELSNMKSPSDEQEYQSLDFYLQLPKALFPPARILAIDPNPIIDIFCKSCDVLDHASWILDLEFGIPKVPLTRAIPIYDVENNSVHCLTSPGAIHPEFDRCSHDFKSTFLYYYDSIVSTWYKGYVTINNDHSVENFQSFLLLPMRGLGMCWA